jgi:dipeptidyl aminopeptidase/acylaminoacyl peptidase
MNRSAADAPPPTPAPGPDWWLDSGLARLAFGSHPRRPGDPANGASTHLAFLPNEALELDLADPLQRDFGEYELLEQIGQGGMGVVYRARQKRLERDVAVKLLSAGPWASEDFIAAFRREARNAASLQHPNIVQVYEMGEHDGLIFYAMQLVRGQSLAQCLDTRGRLPAREAAGLLRTVAEAVDYAHRLGVLHLDLKPGNILLDAEGVAQVTDFGLARRLGQAPSLENEQISGTPSYMAPEQAQVRSTRLSPATDIWGLGAILYELLTGRPPFTGDSPKAILDLVIAGAVRQPTRCQTLPRDLEAICLKCLSRDPQQRYASARTLADDLGRYLEGRAVQARPLGSLQRAARWARREPRLAAASTLAVLALVAGLAATTQQWRAAQANAMTASERLWQGRRQAALGFEQVGEGWRALAGLLQNVREQQPLGLDEAVERDRRRIAVAVGQGAVPIDRAVIVGNQPLAVAVSPDGSRLAIALDDHSVRWFDTADFTELGRIDLGPRSSSGGQVRSITLLRFVGNRRLRATMEWYRGHANPSDGDTWLLDLAARAVLEPPAGFPDFSDAMFSPDGRLALLRDRQRRVQLWQVSPWQARSGLVVPASVTTDALPWLLAGDGRHALALDAGMRRLHVYALPQLRHLHALDFPADAGVSAWAIAPNGDQAALGDGEGRVFLLDLASGRLRTLPSARGHEISWLAFSADGGWLASAGSDGRVHAFDAATGDPLASGSMAHDFPVRRVAISRERRLLVAAGEGRSAVWRIAAAAGPRALPAIRVAMAPAGHEQAGPFAIDWSLSSGLLASAGLDGELRLWRLPVGPTVPVTAPRQVPDRLQPDLGHAIDVEWNQLRVLSLVDGAAGPWRLLDQPPGFAEMVDGGRSVLATVGATLQLFERETLTPRYPPRPLPASPQRLLVDPAGHRALLSVAAPHPDGFGERLLAWDLRSGRQEPGDVLLPGPLLMLAFAADGSRALAVGAGATRTTVLGLGPLRELASYPHDPDAPVVAADFTPDGDEVLLLARAPDPRLAGDTLVRWNPVLDQVRARHDTGAARPYGVLALADGAFLPGEQQHLVLVGDALSTVARSRTAFDAAMGAYAASPDRRLVALSMRRSVALYSAQGEPLGGPMLIDMAPTEGIVELAFAADGSRLLARTVFGLAQWSIAPSRDGERSMAQAELMAALAVDAGPSNVVRVPSRHERSLLRALDPGAWPTPAPRPAPAIAGLARHDASPIPARAAGTSDLLLDLTAHYTVGPEGMRNSFAGVRPFLRPNPAGVQRMGGVDYDLRGMIEVEGAGLEGCVATPAGVRAAAVHALMSASVRTRERRPRTVAELVWLYADGGQAVVPIRTTLEVQGHGGNDQAVPQPFSTRAPRAAIGLRATTLAAPRLVNPQPARPLRCLGLRTLGDPIQVLALTLVPAVAVPSS